jgi:deoxyribodipyrimidine photolyase-related protein
MDIFVIYPNTLCEISYLKNNEKNNEKIKKYHYVIWEHPHFFTKYKYNKKKIMLHRASMKYYYDYLKSHKCSVEYIEFHETFKYKKYSSFDPVSKGITKNSFETPNFLLTKDDYKEYRDKTESFFFHNFYNWSKKRLDIIPDIQSQDKLNRKTNKNLVVKSYKAPSSSYVIESKKYVSKYFANNYGDVDDFNYPITHKDTKKLVTYFIKNKAKCFGDYQDVIDNNDSFLCHSVLSASMNIGLINPSEVISMILSSKNKANMPLNSLEGFIRQLFWREYQRYCYLYCDFSGKYFDSTTTVSEKWYTGSIGCLPVDDIIKRGFHHGYLNHIERLMVIGNYMNLCKIHPRSGFRWFMEFSCDSYEWVMEQNVLDMVFFVTGGKTMKRPYITSSNYVTKMSNYKGDWTIDWDIKYKQFIKDNKKKLFKYRYYFGNFS